VFLRAAVDDDARAQEWLRAAEARRTKLFVPDLIWAEIGQGLWKAVRWGGLDAEAAESIASRIARFPARSESLQNLLPAALATALASGLTVYDACYLALALAVDATLVTFDAKFAGSYDRVELLA
jgi:predicted nucleic acid-binding protein